MTVLSLIDFAKDWLLHLDDKLQYLVGEYKNLTYLILFAIVFVETGLVVMPLLPGDSLLFAAGSIAAMASSTKDLISGASALSTSGDSALTLISPTFPTKDATSFASTAPVEATT